ncbi:phage tail length tape measure family protein [Amnibacterium setariae]|nr:phage tail length tape measure family protein [Amnibacterium setariae]
MSVELARAYVQIVPSMKGVQGEISKSLGAGSPLDKEALSAGKRTGGLLSKGVGGVLGAVTPYVGIAAAGLGIAKLTGYVTDSISAVANWQALNAQSASAVKATGGAANVTAQQVNALAQSLEGQTSTQAESIQQGANLLLTFRGIRNEAGKGNDVFNQTTAAAVDMARALGTDVPSAAMLLGKALNDPAAGMTRLTRSGVTFTKEQQAQVKALQASGDKIGAQKVILAELNKEFGGSGAAYRATFSGQLYQLQDAVGDFGEEIATAAMPALTALVGTASKVVAWAGSLGLGAKAAAGIGSVLQTIGPPAQAAFGSIAAGIQPLLPLIGGLAAGITAFLVTSNFPAIIARLATSFGPLASLLPQIAGAFRFLTGPVGILITLLTAAYASNETFRTAINGLLGTLLGLASNLLGQLMPAITMLVTTLAGALGPVLSSVVPVVTQLATMLASTLTQALQVLTPIIGLVASVLTTVVSAAAPLIGVVVQLAGRLLAALLPAFIQLVQQVLPPVIGILRALIPAITPVIQILGTVLAGAIRALLPIITAVFGAIVPIIRAALQIVTGVINVVVGLLTGNFAQAWRGLKGIVAGAINLVVGVLRGAIGIVGAALTGIVNAGVAILKSSINTVLTIGGQIVSGLANGIRNNAKAVLGAIGGVVNGAIDWAKHLLGIRSPSRVFASIGRYVGQGLVKGLAGSQSQVKDAATSLVNQVTDAFTKLGDQREASQKKLIKLNKQLAATNTSTKSGKASAAKLRDQIAEQRKLVIDLGRASDVSPKQRKNLIATLKADTAQLTSLAGRRDKLAGDLKAAQDKLADAVKVRDDFAAQVKATTIGLGNITDAYADVVDARKTASDSIAELQTNLGDLASSQADASKEADTTRAKLAVVDQQIASLSAYGTDYASKLADLQGNRIDLASTLAEQMGKVADYSDQIANTQSKLNDAQVAATQSAGPAIIKNLQDAISQTQTFQTLLGQLKSFGVDDTTYSQIVEKGVAGGGIGAAQELVQGGPALVQQVAGLQSQLATVGQSLGTQTSTVLYQAGVDAAQGTVDGIKAKIVDNQAAIALLETAMAQSVKVLGINTSALTKGAGAQVAAGFADGIKGKASDLDKVIGELGKNAVNRLKKVLGIHSPSRVFAELGDQTGQGFVNGLVGQQGNVESAIENLVPRPIVGAAASSVAMAPGVAPAPVTQIFNGPMGYTRDEVADGIATKARRAIAGVNIPKVRVS